MKETPQSQNCWPQCGQAPIPVSITQGSPEKQNQGEMYLDIDEDIYGSCNYGGQEVLQPIAGEPGKPLV